MIHKGGIRPGGWSTTGSDTDKKGIHQEKITPTSGQIGDVAQQSAPVHRFGPDGIREVERNEEPEYRMHC